ncbi:unnamed protein product [Larinioides sclopetarius]|uniref:Uncharacterized protein n=1 Tax=Larinioides sclopetarius TaxID=280406 RepID=A0AAV1Z8T6_9ARAC
MVSLTKDQGETGHLPNSPFLITLLYFNTSDKNLPPFTAESFYRRHMGEIKTKPLRSEMDGKPEGG